MFKKGYKQTEQQKLKIGLALKGKKKNYPVWNKGRKMTKEEWELRGFNHKGKTRPLSERLKISETMKLKKEKSHLWKGGITPINAKIRTSLEYRLWREAVFKRDNWRCIWCGIRSGNGKKVIIHADHIKPFCDYPELRFALDNGRTLCIDCHKKTDTYKLNQFRKKDSTK